MKQYTTPVLRMRLCGCKQMLANAVKVETVFRRGSAECRVESQVDGDCVVAALTEAQTGVLCAGPKGHVSAEVTVVGEGVSKSATFYFETFPAVRTEGMGFIGVSDADGDGTVDIELEGEVFPVKSDYELPVATTDSLGGVIVGDGLFMEKGGILHAEVTEAEFQALSETVETMDNDADGYAARAKAAAEQAEASALDAAHQNAIAKDNAEYSTNYAQAALDCMNAAGDRAQAAQVSKVAAADSAAAAATSADEAASKVAAMDAATDAANAAAQAANAAAQSVMSAIGGSY